MRERAAIYCRISKDAEGRELGVQRQEKLCRELAARVGVEVVAVFTDNDLSASTKSKKPRPQYDEMMRRASRREFGVILAYSNSRLTRRPREWEDLIRLYEQHGVRIETCVSGRYDLGTADGRALARTVAAWDAAEAERSGERVRAQKDQAAAQGRWRGGPRPYGFQADGVTHEPAEVEVIRRATKDVLAGRSLTAIVRELNEGGYRTSFGNEWSRHSLRDVLLRPRNAGLIHSGQARRGEIEIIGQAQWDPVVDRDQFDAVCGILLDPVRRRNQSNEPKWLGASIYLCGRPDENGKPCGHLMRSYSVPRGGGAGRRGKPARRLPAYRCSHVDHLSIMAVKTDEFVREVVAEHVRDPRVIKAMTAEDGDALRLDRERWQVLDLRLRQTERDYDDDLIDARRYRAKVDLIEEEMHEIDQRLADAAHHTAATSIFTKADPGAAFLAAPLDVQRAVLRATLRVVVLPYTGPRGAAWSSDRVQVMAAVES